MNNNMIDYSDKDLIRKSLDEFYELYKVRPVKENGGGMKSAHLFNTWYALRQLQPKLVIESGVWKGLGTWVIEQAVPDAHIVSIDVTYEHLEYKSDRAIYLTQDMTTYDWESTFSQYEEQYNIEKKDILVFLDDHQVFLDRLEFVYSMGVKHILYEDNYPVSQGDTYSPKKVLSCRDYVMDFAGSRTNHQFTYFDYDRFDTHVKSYQEMPPIYKLSHTRWGDPWTDDHYPTGDPLLYEDDKDLYPVFYDEAKDYTWICYMELKNET